MVGVTWVSITLQYDFGEAVRSGLANSSKWAKYCGGGPVIELPDHARQRELISSDHSAWQHAIGQIYPSPDGHQIVKDAGEFFFSQLILLECWLWCNPSTRYFLHHLRLECGSVPYLRQYIYGS